MDPGTLVGIVLALVAIFVAMIMEGGNPASILLPPALLLVWLGTTGVTMASAGLPGTIEALKSVMSALLTKKHSANHVVEQLVSMAEKARREGLLALEEQAKSIEDPFLRKGVQMAVDGTDPDEVYEIMNAEIRALKARDAGAAKFFADMGAFAPTLGIIGTVLGLIHVLENLSEPDKLGHLIAGAFVATLWGVLAANVFFLPIGNKLKRVGAAKAHHMELVLEGVTAIQSGANPRVVQQKLMSFLDEAERAGFEDKAA
jgi:chemotaxis protein MotA